MYKNDGQGHIVSDLAGSDDCRIHMVNEDLGIGVTRADGRCNLDRAVRLLKGVRTTTTAACREKSRSQQRPYRDCVDEPPFEHGFQM